MAKQQKFDQILDTIQQGDCIERMRQLPDGCVDLAFADPPFNIGYKYDVYEDRKSVDDYLSWSRDWISQVHRILKDDGTFWLAIGDDFAAELKVLSQQVGFFPRNWVIWYYTFGVHCKSKFTRSHTHLFYFIKNPKKFTFNWDAIAVPSARQLVYNDSRGNPKGRSPDDTWILRPQDCHDGFQPDDSTWYFPRVAGTFKERAGFHGCQMPEQLLGRIIRACSNHGEIVFDPFSGSSTTVAVAKKLERRFLSFEMSPEYVKLGRKRLKEIKPGDPLEGAAEPKVSAPVTYSVKKNLPKRGKQSTASTSEIEKARKNYEDFVSGVIESFKEVHAGFSVDRVVLDKNLDQQFVDVCHRRGLDATAKELNHFLFGLRKSGEIKRLGITTEKRTEGDWKRYDLFLDASEIAWRTMIDSHDATSLDEIFCDPLLAAEFDRIAKEFAPGFQSLEYRSAALNLRKKSKTARSRALRISGLGTLKRVEFHNLARQSMKHGVYLVKIGNKPFYAGESLDLRKRFEHRFMDEDVRARWEQYGKKVAVWWFEGIPTDNVNDGKLTTHLLAYQSRAITEHKPTLNALNISAS